MERKSKNIVCILLIIISLLIICGSVYLANKNLSSDVITSSDSGNTQMMNNGGTPPSMPNGDNGNMTPPDMDGNTPPSMPGTNGNTSSDTTPPEKPNGDNTSDENSSQNSGESSRSTNERPERPGNGNFSEGNMQAPSDFQNEDTKVTSEVKLTLPYIVAISVGVIILISSLLYLIFSGFGAHKVFINFDKALIFILIDIIVSSLLTFGVYYFTNTKILNNNITNTSEKSSNGMVNNTSATTASGALEITDKESKDSDTYTSDTADESAILVKEGGSLTLTDANIEKSGDTTDVESSEFYGINAGILVTENSTATIKNTKINTNSKGSNAVFSTGSDSKIYISNSTITTSKDSSRGLDATYGGYIEADNVKITTQGNSCATLATDRGEGTVIAKNSTLETNGKGSPIIYSTGNITLSDSKGTSNSSQLVVIEGKNSATVENSTLVASGIGNRNNVDNAGVMIYQSMSGDASEGTGTFTVKNSELTIDSNSTVYKSAPMFFITNTDAVINLTNTKLNYGSNTLISIKGTDEWGNSGSNGGNLTFNATNETLKGNIEIDKISTAILNLKSTTLTGSINSDNTAKSIEINLDEDSTLELTGDSYVTVINDDDEEYSNIKSNGYTIYYDSSSNSKLNGKTITLSDGGKLTPAK